MPLICFLSCSAAHQATTHVDHDHIILGRSLFCDLERISAWGSIIHVGFSSFKLSLFFLLRSDISFILLQLDFDSESLSLLGLLIYSSLCLPPPSCQHLPIVPRILALNSYVHSLPHYETFASLCFLGPILFWFLLFSSTIPMLMTFPRSSQFRRRVIPTRSSRLGAKFHCFSLLLLPRLKTSGALFPLSVFPTIYNLSVAYSPHAFPLRVYLLIMGFTPFIAKEEQYIHRKLRAAKQLAIWNRKRLVLSGN